MSRGIGTTQRMLRKVCEGPFPAVVVVPSHNHIPYCVDMMFELQMVPKGTRWFRPRNLLRHDNGLEIRFIVQDGHLTDRFRWMTIGDSRLYRLFMDHACAPDRKFEDWYRFYKQERS